MTNENKQKNTKNTRDRTDRFVWKPGDIVFLDDTAEQPEKSTPAKKPKEPKEPTTKSPESNA